MKLQQLRYAVEVFRHNLNVSEAAEALFTSQPGVSKQIRLLEDELGVQIFIRSGKRIVAVTQVGMAVLETAEQVLRGVRNIKNIGGEFAKTESGSFTLGATHDLLRFRLPSVLAGFRALFPDVRLVLKQGSPAELMGRGMGRICASCRLGNGGMCWCCRAGMSWRIRRRFRWRMWLRCRC